MTKGHAGKYGYRQAPKNPVDGVTPGGLTFCFVTADKVSQDNSFCGIKQTAVLQLGEQSINSIGPLTNILKKQNSTLRIELKWRAAQGS